MQSFKVFFIVCVLCIVSFVISAQDNDVKPTDGSVANTSITTGSEETAEQAEPDAQDAVSSDVKDTDAAVEKEAVLETATPETTSTMTMSATSGSETDVSMALAIQGKADVSYAGTFVYSYPINIPAGTNGVAPNIALTYNSASPNGIMGMGFTISGLPTIERDVSYGINFTSGDHYLYQGMKLFYVSSDGKFHAEKENFERITAYKGSPAAATPDPNDTSSYWLVERKDGSKMYFGSTPDSKIDAVGKSGLPRLWALNRYEDVNGNFYTVQYEEDTTNGDYYPSKIVYTQGNGLTVFKTVQFTYEMRSDHWSIYAPTPVDMDRRLISIMVRVGTDSSGNGGTLVRKYGIEYEYGSDTARSRAVGIQEYGGDGTSALPKVQLTYNDVQHHEQGLGPTQARDSGYGGVDLQHWVADVNGDGMSDVIAWQPGSGYLRVTMGTPSGVLEPTYSRDSGLSSSNLQHWIGDVNGDGMSDVITWQPGSGNLHTNLGTSGGLLGATQTRDSGYGWDNLQHWVADVNGDGRSDVIAWQPGSGYLRVTTGTSSGVLEPTYSRDSGYGYEDLQHWVGDVNGDGMRDVISWRPGEDYLRTTMGTPLGALEPTYTINAGISATFIQHCVADVNGDGMSDVLTWGGGEQYLRSNLGTSSGVLGPTQTRDDGLWTPNVQQHWIGDVNGDGMSDVITWCPGSGNLHTNLGNNGVVSNNDLLSTITTSGGTISATYTPAPQVPGAVVSSDSVYPSIVNARPRPLVTQLVFDNGYGDTVTTQYGYSNGKRYSGFRSDRADLGFRTVTQSNTAAGSRRVTNYNQNKPYQGFAESEYTCAWNGTTEGAKYSGKTYSYAARINTSNPNVQFLYPESITTQIYDGQPGSLDYKMDYEYGDFGDVTKTTNWGYTGHTNGQDKAIIEIEFVSGNSPYVVKPKTKTVKSYDSTGNLGNASLNQFYYDGYALGVIGKGRPTKTEAFDGVAWISTQVAYDVFGNPIHTWDANNNRTDFTYDSTYYDLVAQTTNAKSQTSTIIYNLFRRPFQVTDINEQVTRIGYDLFGRETYRKEPTDDPYETVIIERSDVVAPAQLPRYVHVKQRESGSNYHERYDYYDGLGRLIQTKREGTAPNWITIDYYYDGAGRNYKTSVPYLTGSYVWGSGRDITQKATVLAFDPVGRVVTSTNPDGTYSQSRYQKGITTIVDENGHVDQKEIDLGDSRTSYQKRYTGMDPSITLYSVTTIRNYRGLQQILDDTGTSQNMIEVSLDMLGRKVQYHDPDKGTWSYTYDANGNVLTQTDGKGTVIGFTYDELNRIKQINYPTNTDTVYTYDEAGHGSTPKGRLTSLSFNRGSESYSYDAKGRLSSLTRTLDGTAKTMSYQYDSLDRIKTTTYPDGEVVTNTYGADGNLYSLGGTANYVLSIAYTALGKVSSISYGNGITTSYDYYDTGSELDPSNGNRAYSYRMRTVKAGTSSSVLNLTYEYDAVGNIKEKTDGNNYAWSEVYTYDEHDRLTGSSASVYGSLSFSYNEIDNITMKDGKSYSYGTQPHAVVAVGSASYGYDANGNMTSWKGQTIGYDEAGRMTSLSGANGASYSYGAGTQRTIKTQGTTTTYYYFPQYQEEYTSGSLTRTLKYYEANGQRVAQRSSVVAEGLSYIHADHLGSSVRMTNSSGAVILQSGYKPYGEDAYTIGAGVTKYRFTGQEKEDCGLYYYNARYYDPALGRFIQADAVLDGLNRYAYCHNNPVIYTDPTGEDSLDDGCGNAVNPYTPPVDDNGGGSEQTATVNPTPTPPTAPTIPSWLQWLINLFSPVPTPPATTPTPPAAPPAGPPALPPAAPPAGPPAPGTAPEGGTGNPTSPLGSFYRETWDNSFDTLTFQQSPLDCALRAAENAENLLSDVLGALVARYEGWDAESIALDLLARAAGLEPGDLYQVDPSGNVIIIPQGDGTLPLDVSGLPPKWIIQDGRVIPIE